MQKNNYNTTHTVCFVPVNFEHGGLIDESSTGIFSPSLSYEFPDGSSSHAPPQVDLSLTGGHVKYSTGAKSVKGK